MPWWHSTMAIPGNRTIFETKHSLVLAVIAALVYLTSAAPLCGQTIHSAEDTAIKAAVEHVAPSVVRIETVGGLERIGSFSVGTGPTTGLIISADGYLLSSAFNFVQNPTSILVTLPDGERTAAHVVAKDNNRKLVLLKVDTDAPLAVPEFAPRESIRVGQWSIAVGRTFSGNSANLSVGIVSATNRIWSTAIQTDAKISPANYGGPLIDLQGRVLGLLVPLSPQQSSELAGAEWYDSGIGFAVPLSDMTRSIEWMKQGKTLHRGILGVIIKGKNEMVDPAIIGSTVSNSPAAKAGLKKGDEIIEVDGHVIARHSHLKHALGPRYAGEAISLKVKRREITETFMVELAEKVDPYDLPFLGIQPSRDHEALTVRYVYVDSPAAAAGIQSGDKLVKLDGQEIQTRSQWRENLAALEPHSEIKLTLARAGQNSELLVKLGRAPETIPDDLPPAHIAPAEATDAQVVDIALPEESGKCYAIIPDTYDEEVPHGVVIWLSPPNQFDKQKLLERWQTNCRNRDFLLLAPQPNDEKKWRTTEIAFIRKTLDELIRLYNVDPHRVVVHGYQGGASLAYQFAFEHREVVRGVSAVEAAVPTRLRVLGNDPVNQLTFHLAWAEESKLAERFERDVAGLRKFKYAVVVQKLPGEPRYLGDDELQVVLRWADSLDRL